MCCQEEAEREPNINIVMKDRILDLRAKGKSYSEIASIVKCSKTTVRFHVTGQRCRKENLIDKECLRCGQLFGVPKRREAVAKYCSNECRRGPGINYRKIALNEMNKCAGCPIEKKYLLVVHHINGNHTDNDPLNLEVVCFSCHAKRHLRLTDIGWVVDYRSLTPRELLNEV
jgi:hypothetical protein